jgi:hypothetical protein
MGHWESFRKHPKYQFVIAAKIVMFISKSTGFHPWLLLVKPLMLLWYPLESPRLF